MYDPYVVLGIRRGASAEEVTRAYRALAKKYHPDLNPGDKFAEKKMSEINAAYQQIKTGNVGGAASGYGGSSAYGGSYGQNGGYGQGSGYGQNGGYDYFEQFRRQYGQQYYRQNPTSGKKGGLGWLKVVFVTFLAVQLASLLFMDLSGDDLTEDSGYGTYAIGSATENFLGTTFNVPTYAVICANGENKVTFASSKGNIQTKKYSDSTKSYVNGAYSFKDSEIKDQKTVVNSENFGVDIWGGGTVNVLDGTTFNTGNAAFLIKSGGQFTGAAVNINSSKINSKNNVIMQVIDNEDAAATGADFSAGAPNFSKAVYNETKGWLGVGSNKTLYKATAKDKASTETLNITNAKLTGNIFNGSGYKLMGSTLNVTLGKNANLKGKISATTIKHTTDGGKTQNTTISQDKYYQFGHVINKAHYNGTNKVSVTLTGNSVWNVTGKSVVTSLKVGSNAKVNGKVYVNGKLTNIKAGKTYTGTIVVYAK